MTHEEFMTTGRKIHDAPRVRGAFCNDVPGAYSNKKSTWYITDSEIVLKKYLLYWSFCNNVPGAYLNRKSTWHITDSEIVLKKYFFVSKT